MTNIDIIDAELLFKQYYEKKLNNNIINNSNMYFNSVLRFSLDENYTNKVIPYQYYNNIVPGLNIYTYSINPLEYQPSGYANFSSLKVEFQLILSNNLLNLDKNEIVFEHLIARNYNILRFISGLSGLAWN
jgi:hypothetical protein